MRPDNPRKETSHPPVLEDNNSIYEILKCWPSPRRSSSVSHYLARVPVGLSVDAADGSGGTPTLSATLPRN
jgi:hypothetical protein